MSHLNWEQDVLPAVLRAAQHRFRKDRQREERTADAVSLSWEFTQEAPQDATVWTVAQYAVLRATVGRQFSQSRRSLDTYEHRETHCRKLIDPAELCGAGNDPARIVATRLDMLAWLETLTEQQRLVASELAAGTTVTELATQLRCTPGAVTHCRRRLEASWYDFGET